MLYIVETKFSSRQVDKLRLYLGFYSAFIIASHGISGGVGFFWTDSVEISILSYFHGHVDVLVEYNESHISSYITGFYGNPITRLRYLSWQLLQRIGEGK